MYLKVDGVCFGVCVSVCVCVCVHVFVCMCLCLKSSESWPLSQITEISHNVYAYH